MKVVDLSFHLAQPAVLVWLIVIFVRRRIYREFPLFFAYIIYVPLATALRMSATGNPARYRSLYWITEAIYGMAEILVIREVFRHIFFLEYVAQRWFRFVLPGIVLVIFGFSLWQTVYHPLGRGIPPLVNAVYWFDFGVHLLEGVILLLLLGLTPVFPVDWKQYEVGILTGFGLAASVTLFAYLARFEGGSRYESFFRYGPPLGYILATLVWLQAFFRPPESLPRTKMGPDELLEVVRRSKRLLERIERALGLRRRGMIQPY